MTQAVADIVNIEICETQSGLLVATCKEIPGFTIMHRDVHAILADIPNVLRVLYKRLYQADIIAVPAKSPGAVCERPVAGPWVTVPAHMASTELAAAQ